MFQAGRMGRIFLDTISDYHKHGYDLEGRCCACGHTVILTPDWFLARGMLGKLERLERRLRCSVCKGPAAISSTMLGPSGGRRRGRSWRERT
jgi:hypothetical protein